MKKVQHKSRRPGAFGIMAQDAWEGLKGFSKTASIVVVIIGVAYLIADWLLTYFPDGQTEMFSARRGGLPGIFIGLMLEGLFAGLIYNIYLWYQSAKDRAEG